MNTLIYHKTGGYWGVLENGHSVFSGSFPACIEYLRFMYS